MRSSTAGIACWRARASRSSIRIATSPGHRSNASPARGAPCRILKSELRMDAVRVIQVLTDAAYLLLGLAAITAAIRSPERARFDVALLFGSLAAAVVLQEIPLLTCSGRAACLNVPLAAQLTAVAVLVLPYALLRLVDDIADVPPWQMWITLVLL